ncbi:MAG: class I SAM-dependent methyltransferase, partial [Thermoplasmata archaeon]|nr:class I SAM-dependent methyltransferase [Thermoplasmata archaeon]
MRRGSRASARWTAREARHRQREFWDAAFAGDPDRMGARPSPMLRHALRQLPADGRGLRLVELGCGTGRDLVEFVERGYEVAAIDLSLAAVRATRNRSIQVVRPEGVARPIVDHGEAIEFLATQATASADVVYSNLFLTMGTPERHLTSLLREIARVLRPGGFHLFSVRSTDDAWYGRGRPLAPGVFDLAPDGPPVRFFDGAELLRRTRRAFERVGQAQGREGSGKFARRILYT